MFESFTFFNFVEHLYGATWRNAPGRLGYSHSLSANRRPYATTDGYLSIVPYNERQWRMFLALGGFPNLFDDLKFSDYKSRTENTDELYEYVGRAAITRTTDEWLALLQEEDIPAIGANSLEDVLDDPHLKAVGFFSEIEHPEGGVYRSMRHPVRYSATPAETYRHPPRLGQHDAEARNGLFCADGVS